VQLADDSDKVPDLQRKSYADFRLNRKEWERLELMHEVLQVSTSCYSAHSAHELTFCVQEPANAQQSFSSSKDPTVWRTIPVLEFMQEAWENMAVLKKFEDVREAIEAGLANIRKWYRKVDDTDAYFICLGT
jgi:hypothetical protein